MSDPSQVCIICDAIAPPNKEYQCHYGQTRCCLKCKAFFRRVVQGHGSHDLSSLEFSCQDVSNQCDLTTEKGLKCRKCRLKRCLEVGLKPEKVILDAEGRKKFTGLKKRGGEGGGPEAQNNSRTEIRNYSHFHDSKEVMSPPPPLEVIHPIVQTNSSFAMWTHRQLETGPPRFPTFQIRKHEDGEMEKFKIFGLYESMMMNFIETVAETEIPPFLNVALQEFFTGNILSLKDLSATFMLMRNTFIRFFGKCLYSKTLTINDSMLLVDNNLRLLAHYCIAQFEVEENPVEQFSWLTAKNMLSDFDKMTSFSRGTLERLMLYNGCIQSTVQLEIYRRCCQMVTKNLKGSLFHPGLMFSLILFNTNSWSMGLKGRLLEKDKIEGIYMNLIDLVNKDWKDLCQDDIQERMNFNIAHLTFMDQMMENHKSQKGDLQVVYDIWFQAGSTNRKWLMDRFFSVDEALVYVRPPDMDACLEKCRQLSIPYQDYFSGKIILSNDVLENMGTIYRYAGRIYMARAQFVLQKMFADIELPTKVWRTLLNEMYPIIVLMNICKCMSNSTLDGQIKFFCGIPQSADIGMSQSIEGSNFLKMNDMFGFASPNDSTELMKIWNDVMPFFQHESSFKTILMLFLTENDTLPTMKRFHNEIASALFYSQVGSNSSETDIIGPYYNAMKKIKKILKLADRIIMSMCSD